jgi:hypothetical protein
MLTLLWAPGLWAAPAKQAVAKAKGNFERGRKLFEQGKFLEAIREFENGNTLAPRPLFVFNIAQAHRKLGEANGSVDELTAARTFYKRYLDQEDANAPERVDAVRYLVELESKLTVATPAPVVTLEPPAAALTPSPEPVARTGPPAIIVRPPEAVEEPGFFSRHPVVVALCAVAAVGIATGTYFGVRARTTGCAAASIGCIDANR